MRAKCELYKVWMIGSIVLGLLLLSDNLCAQVKIQLKESFLIKRNSGRAISHIPAVLFTRDGERFIVGTSSGELIIFEAETRRLLKRIQFTDSPLSAVAVDSDGRRLVWLSEKGQLQVMQLETQKVLARKDGIKSKTLAISPQGDAIAIARGKVVQLLRLPGLEVIKGLKGHTAEVTNLAWSPDGKYLASTDNRGVLLLRSNPDHKIIRKIQRPGPLYAVAFSPDSKYVAYGGHQRVLYQFKIGEKRDRVISRGQPYWITCIGYSPDGSTIVIGDESCDIWAYDVSTKKRLLHTKHHVECWLNTVAWTPDSKTFVFGCRPNRYAGKPATYTPLIYQEAVRSSTFQELNKQQRTLQQKLKELCQKDPSLADLYKRFEKLYTRIQGIKLSGKGEVLQYPNLAYDVEKSTVKGIVQAQLARSQVKSKELKKLKELLCQDAKLKGILDQIDKLEKQKGKAIQQRIQELNKNFCINQWSVKR